MSCLCVFDVQSAQAQRRGEPGREEWTCEPGGAVSAAEGLAKDPLTYDCKHSLLNCGCSLLELCFQMTNRQDSFLALVLQHQRSFAFYKLILEEKPLVFL